MMMVADDDQPPTSRVQAFALIHSPNHAVEVASEAIRPIRCEWRGCPLELNSWIALQKVSVASQLLGSQLRCCRSWECLAFSLVQRVKM